jgi:hypothetical protein
MSSLLSLINTNLPPPTETIIDEPAPSTNIEYGKLSWGVAGLLIGTLLDPTTVIIMIILGLFIDNKTLPLINVTPQDFLSVTVKATFNWILQVAHRDKKE